MKEIRIRAPGSPFGEILIDTEWVHSCCGDVEDGISARLATERAGFVLSWEDFEAAYLKLKTLRGAR